MYLKDRSKPPTEDEKDWYDKAFGLKRNVMTLKVRYFPYTLREQAKKGLCDFFAVINYKMYSEMEDEFNPSAYEEEFKAQLFVEEGEESDNLVFRYEIELPYGDVKCNVLIRPKNRSALEEEENKLIEPPPNELEYISVSIEPEPISAE